MKYIIIILIVMTTLSCKAQSPIVSLKDFKNVEITNGVYYKDIDGDLNQYVGTWKYTNGTTSLTIKFKKIVQYYNGECYEDVLVGDYKYIEKANVLVDFLNRVDNPIINDAQHYITGNTIIYPNQFITCDDCTTLERRIKLDFTDPERTYLVNAVTLRYINDNGIQKIQLNLFDNGTIVLPSENSALETRVPYGYYELIKE